MATTPGAGGATLIAIVDDDASVARSTRRLVRSFGFNAEAFDSAETFLDSDCIPRTACIILDVRMPGMDGLELQHRLAERQLRIPVVFLTGHASAEEEKQARHAGAAAFLRKPVARDILRRVLLGVLP